MFEGYMSHHIAMVVLLDIVQHQWMSTAKFEIHARAHMLERPTISRHADIVTCDAR